MYRKIHLPSTRWTPVLKQNVLTAIAVPVEIHLLPEPVDSLRQPFFLPIAIPEILANTQKALHQIAGFNEVAPVVIASEGSHMPGAVIQPMRPCSVESIGFFKKGDDFLNPLQTLFTRNIVSMYSCQDAHK